MTNAGFGSFLLDGLANGGSAPGGFVDPSAVFGGLARAPTNGTANGRTASGSDHDDLDPSDDGGSDSLDEDLFDEGYDEGGSFAQADFSDGPLETSATLAPTTFAASAPVSEGAQATQPPPMQPRPKACDVCFRLRKKCSLAAVTDPVLPPDARCQACIVFNRECVFTREVQTRGPKKGSQAAGARRRAGGKNGSRKRRRKSTSRRESGTLEAVGENGNHAEAEANGHGESSGDLADDDQDQENDTMDYLQPSRKANGAKRTVVAAVAPAADGDVQSLQDLVDRYAPPIIKIESVDSDTILPLQSVSSRVAPAAEEGDEDELMGYESGEQEPILRRPSPALTLGREIGPFRDLQPLPPSSDLLRVVQDYFMVNNVNSQMKLVHFKTFFPSMSSRTVTSLFNLNELYPSPMGVMPPPLPLFLAMASLGFVMEPSSKPLAPVSNAAQIPAPLPKNNLDITLNFGSPLSLSAFQTRSASNNLARYSWTFVQPWLERLGITYGANPVHQEPPATLRGPIVVDPAVLNVLFTVTTLLWRSSLFLRMEATRSLLNIAISLAFKMGCKTPESLLIPYPASGANNDVNGQQPGRPTGIDFYRYYKAQLFAESLRRTFWALYVHDRTLLTLDPSIPAIPDAVAWAMNLPCQEADFDIVSETLSAADIALESVQPDLASELLDRIHWDRLPRALVGEPFAALRCKGSSEEDANILMDKRFVVAIAANFLVGKVTMVHLKGRALGIEVFDPNVNGFDPAVHKMVNNVRKMQARIQGFYNKFPQWYVDLDADPAGFLERENTKAVDQRRGVEMLNGAFNELFVARLACILAHGPLKPDPTNPAHRAWLSSTNQNPNHLARIAAMLPPLTNFPDLSNSSRLGRLPIFAIDHPELSVAEVCLHHTMHLIDLIRAFTQIAPGLLRNSVIAHHAIVQAAVYRAVLAIGGVLPTPPRSLGSGASASGNVDSPMPSVSSEEAVMDALSDIEFIEFCLGRFRATHIARDLSKDVVSAVKRQLVDSRSALWRSSTTPLAASWLFDLPRPGSATAAANRRTASSFSYLSSDAGFTAPVSSVFDDGDTVVSSVTSRAAESGLISDGLASLIAQMDRPWMEDGSLEVR